MKIAVIALFIAASAFAQNSSAGVVSACGPDYISYKVKLDKKGLPLIEPTQGKALVYFIHDSGRSAFNRISNHEDGSGRSMGGC